MFRANSSHIQEDIFGTTSHLSKQRNRPTNPILSNFS